MNGQNRSNELWYGSPGCKDHLRSLDEIRIIKEMAGQEVEQFLAQNEVDPIAARELKNEPPHVALAVVDGGTLSKCRNPSGALVARIRDARRGIVHSRHGKGGGPKGGAPVMAQPLDPNASELDKFLAMNGIDPAACTALRSETPEVQNNVMAMGSFTTSTNPSASLMARIKTVKNPDFRLGEHHGPRFQNHMQNTANPGFPGHPGTNPQFGMANAPNTGYAGTAPQLALPSTSPAGFPGTNPQMGNGDPADINSESAKAIEKLKASLGQPDEPEPIQNEV